MSRYECDVKHTDRETQRNERLAAIEQELAGHPHRRVPRDLRRRHLLELATELFSERGFEAASMDGFAQRAGVSKPVIYDQFGSKEGLVVAVVDAMGIELNEAIRARRRRPHRPRGSAAHRQPRVLPLRRRAPRDLRDGLRRRPHPRLHQRPAGRR